MENSIYKNGYGKIAKIVIRDKELTIEAKAIYAYLCSFSGDKLTSFPTVKLITSELKITKTRYYKHLDILIKRNYISKIQVKTNGLFKNNIFTITVNLSDIHPCPNFGYTENGDTENKDTNNNNINNNNYNRNTVFNKKRKNKKKMKIKKEEKEEINSFIPKKAIIPFSSMFKELENNIPYIKEIKEEFGYSLVQAEKFKLTEKEIEYRKKLYQ